VIARRRLASLRSVSAAAALLLVAFSLSATPLSLRVERGDRIVEADVETSEVSPSDLVVTFRLPGFRGASLDAIRLSKGLDLVAVSARPYVQDDGTVGSEIVLEISPKSAGRGGVEALRFVGESGIVDIASFTLPFPEAESPTDAIVPWVWRAPLKVWIYEAFPVNLAPADGQAHDDSAWPSFELPSGLFLEGRDGAFSWMATALEVGSLRLPEARIVSRKEGKADARLLEVEALPPAVAESRAVGDFSLSLELPTEAETGSPLSFRLVLTGEGDLPSLRLPEPSLSLGGTTIAASLLNRRRIDSFGPSPRGYRGSVAMDVVFVPDRPGRLLVSCPPWAYLDSEGKVVDPRLPRGEVEISPSRNASAEEGRTAALGLIQAASVAKGGRRFGNDGDLVAESLANLHDGRVAPALAELYGAARRDSRFRSLAFAVAAKLGIPVPDLGFPISPIPFFAVAFLSLAVAAVLLRRGALSRATKARAGETEADGSPARRVVLALCLGGAIAGAVLGTISSVDGSTARWLCWSDSLSSRPAADAEHLIHIVAGGTGRLVGSSGNWVCLEFPDGSSGWLPRSSVYSY